jgi:hypothetical protein
VGETVIITYKWSVFEKICKPSSSTPWDAGIVPDPYLCRRAAARVLFFILSDNEVILTEGPGEGDERRILATHFFGGSKRPSLSR